jgi:hypothetical protein
VAICASLDVNNYVQANTTPPADCTGYLVLDSTEYADLSAQQWTLEEGRALIIVAVSIWFTCWLFRQVFDFMLTRK